jgi:hypothetical protein
MAKTKQKKASKAKTKSSSKGKSVKRKSVKKPVISPEERKMEIIETYLQEIYHLTGHSIAAGTEAENPWYEIMYAMMALHNELDISKGHQIQGIKILCDCGAKEHSLEMKNYVHDCE